MGLFDFFKSKQKPTPPEAQDVQTAAGRLAEWEPVLSRGPVPNAPAGFDHFNLQDVMIGTVQGKYKSYLFGGDNAAALIYDLRQLNRLAAEANALFPGLPDFSIQNTEVVVDPFPCTEKGQWLYSRIIVEPPTPTGKQKKYPVKAYVETFTGLKHANLYYTLDGIVGKGSVHIIEHLRACDSVFYEFDFINGVVSHVWKGDSAGKTVLYNKNGNV